MDQQIFQILLTPPLRHVCRKIYAGVDGGLSGGSSMCRPGSEEPNRHQRNSNITFTVAIVIFLSKVTFKKFTFLKI